MRDTTYQETPPLTTWQYYNAALHILGMSFFTKLEGKQKRLIYKWAADPDFSSEPKRNPLDRIKKQFSALVEKGREDIVRACIDMLAESLPQQEIIPDKFCLEEELLDDYPTLVNLHNAIRANKNKKRVKQLAQAAKREIDETFALYAEKKAKQDKYK